MKSEDIKKAFLKYFKEKGHIEAPSSSLVPKDPTVLLTLAGMLQFKPFFLGIEKPKFKRAASIQKCVRMNDIENVGKTSRHHTFFEMLGNFSFGDYFKEDAIFFAWELLTGVFKLPKEKLGVAVYEKDDEAYEIWKNKYNIQKLFRLSEENNFWAAGPTGPCGPCSEIYYDYGKDSGCNKPDCNPGCDCERWLEIWNLVFIEFNRDENGNLHPLPSKNIDTGMGLERISRLLQNVKSNFDTDLFLPILEKLPKINEISRRIIADHIRAATYLIADGVIPGNEGRAYVLRRIIRRAALHGQKLGIKDVFLPELSKIVIDMGQSFYPELNARSKVIYDVIKAEEESFNSTLGGGMKLLDEMLQKYKDIIPGEEAFKLHDTYGFPIEMTKEIAAGSGVKVDILKYNAAMEAQRSRAREAMLSSEQMKKKIDTSKYPKTVFAGYEKTECDAHVLAVLNHEKIVILDKTPFYPNGGGQIGDSGIISFNGNDLHVQNTLGEVNGIILHLVDRVENLKEKQSVKVKIDKSRRAAASAHHTATHLLHAALRSIKGEGATQAGSFVAPDKFRFDFHLATPLNQSEIEKIEEIVNENIKSKLKVEVLEKSVEEAQKMGAMALFGEKYGKKVRVVKIGKISMELCGGTHVKNTGEIQFFKILKEEALQTGIRRIEAIAGSAAKINVIYKGKKLRDSIYKLMHQNRALLDEKARLVGGEFLEPNIFEIDQEEIIRLKKAVDVQDIVNVNKFLSHLRGRVEWLTERNHALEKEIEKLKGKKALGLASEIISEVKNINGVKVLIKELKDISIQNARSLMDEIRAKMPSGIIIFAAVNTGKVSFLVTVSDDLTARYNAGKLAKTLAEICLGGGGGGANKAEAGGKDPSKIKEAFSKALEIL